MTQAKVEVFYDKKGIPIHDFDILKCFHFQTKRKKYYMYKSARFINGNWVGIHLTNPDPNEEPYKSCFWLKAIADKQNILKTVEIVERGYFDPNDNF